MAGMDLKGKRVIVIGERDGVSGVSIETCIKSIGATIVFVETQCFV